MDTISIARLALLHPKLRAEVSEIINSIEATGVDIRITQGLRTFAEQDALYAQGRTAPGKIVTQAKGGQSPHNFGLAIDFCLHHKDGSVSFDMTEHLGHAATSDWLEVVNSFKYKGWVWGGDWATFKDNDHVEKMLGLTLAQALELKTSGKVDDSGYILIP